MTKETRIDRLAARITRPDELKRMREFEASVSRHGFGAAVRELVIKHMKRGRGTGGWKR